MLSKFLKVGRWCGAINMVCKVQISSRLIDLWRYGNIVVLGPRKNNYIFFINRKYKYQIRLWSTYLNLCKLLMAFTTTESGPYYSNAPPILFIIFWSNIKVLHLRHCRNSDRWTSFQVRRAVNIGCINTMFIIVRNTFWGVTKKRCVNNLCIWSNLAASNRAR